MDGGTAGGGAEAAPTRRLTRPALLWRAAVTALVGLLAVYGTVLGNDDLWPFAPQSQFAFRIDPDGEIGAARLDALTADGTVVRVPLSVRVVGISRAEIEGQLPAIVADPSLLQGLAVAHRRLRPAEPRLVTLWLGRDVTDLEDGHVAGVRVERLAEWQVRGAG